MNDAARVGFEPTELPLGRFQGGCTSPLCDLAMAGGPVSDSAHSW